MSGRPIRRWTAATEPTWRGSPLGSPAVYGCSAGQRAAACRSPSVLAGRAPGTDRCRAGRRPQSGAERRAGPARGNAPEVSAADRVLAWWRPGMPWRAGPGARCREGGGVLPGRGGTRVGAGGGGAGGPLKEAEISAPNSARSHCGSPQIRSANAASASRVARVMPITLPGTCVSVTRSMTDMFYIAQTARNRQEQLEVFQDRSVPSAGLLRLAAGGSPPGAAGPGGCRPGSARRRSARRSRRAGRCPGGSSGGCRPRCGPGPAASPLVYPQGLRVQPGQFRGHRDAEQAPVKVRPARVHHGQSRFQGR